MCCVVSKLCLFEITFIKFQQLTCFVDLCSNATHVGDAECEEPVL